MPAVLSDVNLISSVLDLPNIISSVSGLISSNAIPLACIYHLCDSRNVPASVGLVVLAVILAVFADVLFKLTTVASAPKALYVLLNPREKNDAEFGRAAPPATLAPCTNIRSIVNNRDGSLFCINNGTTVPAAGVAVPITVNTFPSSCDI